MKGGKIREEMKGTRFSRTIKRLRAKIEGANGAEGK